MNSKTERPLSQHLTIWKWGPHMLVSILHRVTGGAITVVGLAILAWWLAAIAGGELAYDRFAKVSEAAIRATDTGHGPWRIIDSEDRHFRDISAGELVLAGIEQACAALPAAPAAPAPATAAPAAGKVRSVLDTVDLNTVFSDRVYTNRLEKAQARLNALAWKAREMKRSTVVVFEGWDAAGKGGAIRRVTAAVDARLYRVIPVAAPTDEERHR